MKTNPSAPSEKRLPSLGHKRWVIPGGNIPHSSRDLVPEMAGHETACLLNTSDQDAHVEITVYYTDAEPVGPYKILVPSRRTKHISFNDLTDPAPIPRATDFASVIESDVPVVVQYTRMDSRPAKKRPDDRRSLTPDAEAVM